MAVSLGIRTVSKLNGCFRSRVFLAVFVESSPETRSVVLTEVVALFSCVRLLAKVLGARRRSFASHSLVICVYGEKVAMVSLAVAEDRRVAIIFFRFRFLRIEFREFQSIIPRGNGAAAFVALVYGHVVNLLSFSYPIFLQVSKNWRAYFS